MSTSPSIIIEGKTSILRNRIVPERIDMTDRAEQGGEQNRAQL